MYRRSIAVSSSHHSRLWFALFCVCGTSLAACGDDAGSTSDSEDAGAVDGGGNNDETSDTTALDDESSDDSGDDTTTDTNVDGPTTEPIDISSNVSSEDAGGGGAGGSGGVGGSSGSTNGGGAGDAAGGSAGSDTVPDGGSAGAPSLGATEGLIIRMIDELGLGALTEDWVADVTREPLAPTRVISSSEGGVNFVPAAAYSFMFLDRMPRAGYGHDTQFIFAEGDAPLTVEDHSWWPDLDGTGFVVSDVDLVKLFPPRLGAYPASVPYPGAAGEDHRGSGSNRSILAFYPDYAADSGEVRLFFYADEVTAAATPAYINFLADLDRDGVWEPSEGEQLVTDFVLPSASAGWAVTDPFTLPVDAANKFPSGAWTRLVISAEPGDEPALEECDDGYRCNDDYRDFGGWSGKDCDGYGGPGLDFGGCDLEITWAPAFVDPPVPDIEGVESAYVCSPDGVVIPTVTKALVINMGDNPGRDETEYTMNKVAAIFALHFGDEAVAKLSHPTAATALESIRTLVGDLQCLDEAHIYILGHGYKGTGTLYTPNGLAGVTREQLHEAITGSAEHCPSPMDYATDGCREPGYCNLNVYFGTCYSGLFLEGDASLNLPGINVLTAASATLEGWADVEGFTKGEHVAHAFTQGFVDNAADAAPFGNGDGIVDPAEAQRYAHTQSDQSIVSDPKLEQNADCTCQCEANPCGNGTVDQDEQCDPSDATSQCDANLACNAETCQCECDLFPEDCAPLSLDLEACECVGPLCGDEVLDPTEECEGDGDCPVNFVCAGDCVCDCNLEEADCDSGQELDVELCECVPIDHCPPVGTFHLFGQFSLFSDLYGHSCCHNVPLLVDIDLPFTRTGGSFTSPGLPGDDIPPLSGTLVNDSILGCQLTGSGIGSFAGYPNSSCVLQNALILDDVFTGRVSCTPSGFPGQPIIFDLDAFMTAP